MGCSGPYRKVREKAGNYLRHLAHGEDNDHNEDEDLDDNDCTLPTASTVRVFRPVNGNLEIPPALFKALAVAGRLHDAFFPDEPGTWERSPLRDNSTDGGSEAPYNGTQTCVPTVDNTDGSDNGGSGHGDSDDDDRLMVVAAWAVAAAVEGINAQVFQATYQFLQQHPQPRRG
ncbi:hypothetical protein SEUCBS139899_006115 [Sporothrix eucalyptigena]